MKRCKKCNKDYPDMDNYCISCGSRLVPLKPPITSTEGKQIHRRMDTIEKRVKAIPSRPQYVHALRKKMDTFEKRMIDTTSSLRSSLKEVDKKAERLGQVKFTPEQDAVSIARELNTTDAKITSLNDSINALRSDMPKAEHILAEIEQRLIETKGALFAKQQHELEEMAKRIGMIESRIEETERDIEESVGRMRRQSGAGDMSKFLSVVNDNKRRIEGVEAMRKEFESVKKRSASFNAQEIKDNIMKDFEKINSSLVESVEQKKTEIQRIEQETAKMREGIESLKELEKKVGGVNSEGISRDLEILKTKTKWLEEQLEGLDIKPLHDRLKELELDLNRITTNSPLVVE
jgi:chromosome segregation ATPase